MHTTLALTQLSAIKLSVTVRWMFKYKQKEFINRLRENTVLGYTNVGWILVLVLTLVLVLVLRVDVLALYWVMGVAVLLTSLGVCDPNGAWNLLIRSTQCVKQQTTIALVNVGILTSPACFVPVQNERQRTSYQMLSCNHYPIMIGLLVKPEVVPI